MKKKILMDFYVLLSLLNLAYSFLILKSADIEYIYHLCLILNVL